ncbi:MAG: cobalamin B12-binding domain-containing protein [Firmicutes bacterium]|nr:cobalamin B12-binding domain-containing protein [Bacillota bacterium]
MARVLLVQPRPSGGVGFGSTAVVEPLGLEAVGGALLDPRWGPPHEVRLVDMLVPGDLDRALAGFRPEMCGISCGFTMDVYRARSLARRVKEARPGCFVFVGGHHASLCPEDLVVPEVDAVVVGEGEITARELVDTVARGGCLRGVPGLVLNTPDGPVWTEVRPPASLDDLPVAARHLTASYRGRYYLGLQAPMASVETARGCPYRCTFCSVWKFYGGTVRAKSPARVAAELEQVKEEYVLITDDNFLLSVPRAEAIARELRQNRIRHRYTIQARSDTLVKHPDLLRLWKEVGLYRVFVGIEKVDDEELQALDKRNTVENNVRALDLLRRLGIAVTPSFIVDPDYTRRQFERLRAFLRRYRISAPSIAVLTPLPGTELYRKWRDRLTTTNYELFDLFHSVVPTRLKLEEFYREFTSLYRTAVRSSGYLIPNLLILLRNVVTGRVSPGHVWRIARGVRCSLNPRFYLRGHLAGSPSGS